MSYIDTQPHEHLGYLAGIPLYHPLGSYDDDFVAGPEHVVLGGGGGEHPAAVFHPLACVTRTLFAVEETFEDSSQAAYDLFDDTKKFRADLHSFVSMLVDLPYYDPAYETDWSHWGSDEWVGASEAAKKWGFDRSKARLERWLEECVGEYLLVCYRELIVGALPNLTAREAATLERVGTHLGSFPIYQAVYSYPRGYRGFGRAVEGMGPNVRP